MSTSWHLVCTSHEPNLASEGFYSRPDPLIKDLERREVIVGLPDWLMEQISTDEWSDTKAWLWLRDHATCKVEIYNEYGKSLAEWEADSAQTTAIRKHQTDNGLCTLIYGPSPYRVCALPANHQQAHDMAEVWK